MKSLEESKIWALWGILTLTYPIIILSLGNFNSDTNIGLQLVFRCGFWNFFCLSFLFDYTEKVNK